MKPLYFFLLFFFYYFFQQSLSHISSLNSVLVPQNAKLVTSIHIFFSFTTPLTRNDFIFLTLPFKIGSNSDFFLSEELSIEKKGPYQALRYPSLDPNHILNFNLDILGNKWYRLQIIINDKTNQNYGSIGCISMKTISQFENDYITYDESDCLDRIVLAPEINSEKFVVEGGISKEYLNSANNFGDIYKVYFDVLPHIASKIGGIIELKIENENFNFGPICQSVSCKIGDIDCRNDMNINVVPGNTCDTQQQKLTFKMTIFTNTEYFRIQAYIVNPSKLVSENQKITAIYRDLYTELYYGVTTVTNPSSGGEPLLIKTKYPPVLVSTYNRIFWGVLNDKDTKYSCPLTLYSSRPGGILNIYNSLSSYFVLDREIQSLAIEGNLKIIWNIVSDPKYIDSVLSNSISTNLPMASNQDLECSIDGNILSCKNVRSLQMETHYFISCKFAIKPSSNTLTTSDYTLMVGKIVIATGNDQIILQSTYESFSIKVNQEYIDTTTTTGWHSINYNSKVFYNFVYSFNPNEVNLDWNPISNTLTKIYITISNYFLGDSTSTKVGAFATPSSSSNFGLFVPLYAKSTQICKNDFINNGNKCDIPFNDNSFHVMLKIVFNNNILNIDSSNWSKGVLLVGVIFGKTLAIQPSYSDYDTPTDQARTKITNQIFQYDQTSIFGGTTYHVNVICKQNNNFDNVCHSITARTTSDFAGIAFLKTNLQNYPSLYQDSYIFDFLLCFKLLPQSVFDQKASIDPEWTLFEVTSDHSAGPGVIQNYVITEGKSNYLKVSFANYYYKATGNIFGDGKYIASYIRIKSYFTTSQIKNTEAIALGLFLLGGSNFESLSFYSDYNNNVNSVDVIEGGNIYAKVLKGGDKANSEDIWWSHSGILLKKKIKAETYYDFYVPIKIDSTKITSLNLILLDYFNNYCTVKFVYRVYGSSWQSASATSYIIESLDGNAPFTAFNSNYNIENTNGCSISGGDSPKIITESSSIKPGVSKTLQINSFINYLGSGLNCAISPNKANNIGGMFAIYFRNDYSIENNNLVWDFAPNKCIVHKIFCKESKGCLGKTKDAFFFTILCTVDDEANSLSSHKLNIVNFNVPNFWGVSFNIFDEIQYVWSKNTGVGVSLIRESISSSTWYLNGCTVDEISNLASDSNDIYYILGIQTENEYNLTSTLELKIEHKFSIDVSNKVKFNECNMMNNENITCEVRNNIFGLKSSSNYYQTIGKKTKIYIEIFIDVYSDEISLNHYVNLYNNSILLEKCSEKANLIMNFLKDTSFSEIKIKNLIFGSMQSSRNDFKFTFQSKRTVRSSSYFIVDLGFFAFNNNNLKNINCFVNQGISECPSNEFASIYFDSQRIVFAPKETLKSDLDYNLICKGVKTTNQTLLINYMTYLNISLFRDSVLLAFGCVKSLEKFPTTENVWKDVTINKFINNKGFDADYKFYFKIPLEIFIDVEKSKYKIEVMFSKSILPKINIFGYLECYINDILTFCELTNDRKVALSIENQIISGTNNSFEISNVHQPYNPDTNFDIYISLIQNNVIVLQTYVNDILPNDVSNYPIVIESFSISEDKSKSKADFFNIIFLLGNNSIDFSKENLILQLPYFFMRQINLFDKIQCSLMNSNDLTLRFSKSCKVLHGNKLLVEPVNANLKLSYSNETYILSILSIYTSETAVSINSDVTLMIVNTELGLIISSSSSGYRKANNYPTFIKNKNVKNLFIYDSYFENIISDYIIVNIGLYTTVINIGIENKSRFIGKFDIELEGRDKNLFILRPSKLTINNNDQTLKLSIASLESVRAGFYLIKFLLKGDNSGLYSEIPILILRVLKQKCKLKYNFDNFFVPYSGKSFPLIIYLSECYPASNLTIGVRTTNYFSVDKKPYSLNNIDPNSNVNYTSFYFYFDNSQNYSNNVEGIAQIYILGNNAFMYQELNNISLILQDSENLKIASTLRVDLIKNEPSKTVFSLFCDQNATIYYVLGLTKNIVAVKWKKIFNYTEAVYLNQTSLKKWDSQNLIMGHFLIQNNIEKKLALSNCIRAGYEYTAFFYSVNQLEVITFNNFTWVQAENEGKLVFISLSFDSKLSDYEENLITCFFDQLLNNEYTDRILNKNGNTCRNAFRRLSQNIANSTTNTSNDSIKTTISNNYYYRWFILKDYFTDIDLLSSTLQKNLLSEQILLSKISNLDIKNVKSSLKNASIEYFLNNNYLENIISNFSVKINVIDSVTFKINGTKIDKTGFFLYGIGQINQSMPNLGQLNAGLDGEDKSLIIRRKISFDENNYYEENFFNISTREEDNYTIFYALTNFDPIIDIQSVIVNNQTIILKKSAELFDVILSSRKFVLLILIIKIFFFFFS